MSMATRQHVQLPGPRSRTMPDESSGQVAARELHQQRQLVELLAQTHAVRDGQIEMMPVGKRK